jgi:hypothetical protein
MKRWNPWLLGALVTVCAWLLVLPTVVRADDPANGSQFRFQYAAKFLCTADLPGTSLRDPAVLPGEYRTIISIHNPQNRSVQLRKKIALTFLRGQEQPGQISKFILERLNTDEAIQVDCTEIPVKFGIQFIDTGVQGFLVVESAFSLDVNAVHIAGKNGDQGGEVESIAVEQVRERRLNQND